jgi:hypothetical protein
MPAWAIWMPIVGGLVAYVLGWGLVFVADLVQRRDAPGRSVWIAPGVAFVGTVGLCVLFCVDKAPAPTASSASPSSRPWGWGWSRWVRSDPSLR